MSEHTPTPWEQQDIIAEGDEAGCAFIIGAALGGLVCGALPWPTELDNGDFSRVEANAAFIVKAVNLHDELVAALRDALTYVDRYESDNFSNVALDVSIRAHAVLSKAEPTP